MKKILYFRIRLTGSKFNVKEKHQQEPIISKKEKYTD